MPTANEPIPSEILTPETIEAMKRLEAANRGESKSIRNMRDNFGRMTVEDVEQEMRKGPALHVNQDLETRFTYHAPKPGQPELYQALREQAKALAYRIVQTVPAGREQASALTFLENSIFWANAGIARHGQ